VTSIGDIEIELVFRITVRGRIGDLAELTRRLDGSNAVILLPVKVEPRVQEDREKQILVTIRRSDP
jgi:hypothetical protein